MLSSCPAHRRPEQCGWTGWAQPIVYRRTGTITETRARGL